MKATSLRIIHNLLLLQMLGELLNSPVITASVFGIQTDYYTVL